MAMGLRSLSAGNDGRYLARARAKWKYLVNYNQMPRIERGVPNTLIVLLLQPTLFHPPTTMIPKPKLNVHNFPRPPLLEKVPRHLQVKWRDQTIADTKDAYWVLETTHPPSIPSESTYTT